MSTVNVDVKLGVNKFIVDETNPHIILVADPHKPQFRKLITACTAAL